MGRSRSRGPRQISARWDLLPPVPLSALLTPLGVGEGCWQSVHGQQPRRGAVMREQQTQPHHPYCSGSGLQTTPYP